MRSTTLLVALFATVLLGGCSTAAPATSAPSVPSSPPATAVATPVASAATTVAPPTSVPTQAPATVAPTLPPVVTAAPATPASTAPPSPAGTPVDTSDVEALLPTDVGGIALEAQTGPVAEFLASYPAFATLVGALGLSPSDVSIVQAQGSRTGEIVIVQAFRVAGADTTALLNGVLEVFKVTNDVAAPITIAGKQLIVQGHPDTDAQYKTYYYAYGDVIFRLGYNGDNFDEMMAELVSQLP